MLVTVDWSTMRPGSRWKIRAPGNIPVRSSKSLDAAVTFILPAGAVVVIAEVNAAFGGCEGVRISSPTGWIDPTALDPAGPAASFWQDLSTFESRHLQLAAGDNYGIVFPISISSMLEFGTSFLTQAFRAAGTISPNNEVSAILELKPLNLSGASQSAFMTVAYAVKEPGLHTALFVKFPPDREVEYKHELSVMAHGEVEMQRLTRREDLPIKAAKYYFGDFSSHTLNYILITERIAFGVPPIEPAYRKGADQLIPDAHGHYLVLTRALAAVVGAHKSGALGVDIEEVFPFARAARNFEPIANPEPKIDRLIDFVGRVAPQFFPIAATQPSFLSQWKSDLLFGLDNKDPVVAYLHANVDYTGLCHPNLNPDNAWFWRDEAGELHAGLLDWGGAGQMSIAQALSSMLMMPDPDGYIALRNDVVETFIAECAARGGPVLDPDELMFQIKASFFTTAIGTIVAFVVEMLFRFSDEEFRSMTDRFDPRLQDSGLAAAIIWICNLLQEWTEQETPGSACRTIVARADLPT